MPGTILSALNTLTYLILPRSQEVCMTVLIIPTFQMPKIGWLGDGRTETQTWTVGLQVLARLPQCYSALYMCQLSLFLGRKKSMGEIQQRILPEMGDENTQIPLDLGPDCKPLHPPPDPAPPPLLPLYLPLPHPLIPVSQSKYQV